MSLSKSLPAVFLVFCVASSSGAASLYQTSDFQTGTSQGWSTGAVLNIVANGGPDGAGDQYMQISQTEFHIGAKNGSTFTGNFLAAGIRAIDMDLNHINPGVDDLALRVVLFGPGGSFTTINPVPVATNTWAHYVFGIRPEDLMRIFGSGSGYTDPGVTDVNATLADVTEMNFRHDPFETPTNVGNHPEHVTATLGVDNIRAIPYPGDADASDTIDGADLALWQGHYDPLGLDAGNTFGDGDWNADGKVDGADLAIWQGNYAPLGVSSGALGAGGGMQPLHHAPEPATLASLSSLLVLLGACRLRRKR